MNSREFTPATCVTLSAELDQVKAYADEIIGRFSDSEIDAVLKTLAHSADDKCPECFIGMLSGMDSVSRAAGNGNMGTNLICRLVEIAIYESLIRLSGRSRGE